MKPFACLLLTLATGCSTALVKPAPEGQALSSSPAIQLVKEYVERDAKGERLQTNPWFLDVVAWPDEPGYDSYTVISGYVATPLSADSSTARVRVDYRRAGYVRTTGARSVEFEQSIATESHVFTVALSDNGWRITAPQIEQHVLVETALSLSPLNEGDKDRLSKLRRASSP
jgi:hypothetical protein